MSKYGQTNGRRDERRTQTADGTADGLPEREQKADSRERLFPTAQRPRVLLPVVVLRQVLIVGIDLQHHHRQTPLHNAEDLPKNPP